MISHTCGKTSDEPVTEQCADTCAVVMSTPNEMKLAEEVKQEARRIVSLVAARESEIRKMGFPSLFLEAMELSIERAILSYGNQCAAEAAKECERAAHDRARQLRIGLADGKIVTGAEMVWVEVSRLVAAKYEGGE